MKKIALCMALVALLSLGGQAFAEIGAIDAVPASTLLLPYFQVSPGVTTLFSINNASAAPQVAHVTLWTNLSRPTLDFTVYLTGYDVITINLNDLFSTGAIPVTGPNRDQSTATQVDVSGAAPGDFSFADAAFPNCVFPLPANIPSSLLSYIQNVHNGQAAPNGFLNSGLCGGTPQDADTYVGYLTVDVVNNCSTDFPSTAGYFADAGTGTAGNQNVLWGDWFLVDVANAFAFGENLIHIEAVDSVGNGFWAVNDYTFYGRYVAGTAVDNREPLATTWAVRYFSGAEGAFDDDSDIYCWRDTGRDESAYFLCGTTPSPFPLAQTQLVIFDEFENPIVVEDTPFSPPPTLDTVTPCPWESNRTGATEFGSVFDFGWFYMNLNTTITGALFNPIKQSWVGVSHSAAGLFTVGYPGVHLDSALANITGGVVTPKTFTVTTGPNETLLPVPGAINP